MYSCSSRPYISMVYSLPRKMSSLLPYAIKRHKLGKASLVPRLHSPAFYRAVWILVPRLHSPTFYRTVWILVPGQTPLPNFLSHCVDPRSRPDSTPQLFIALCGSSFPDSTPQLFIALCSTPQLFIALCGSSFPDSTPQFFIALCSTPQLFIALYIYTVP